MQATGDHAEPSRPLSVHVVAATLIGSLLALTMDDPGQAAAFLETLKALPEGAVRLPLRGEWPW